MTDKFLYGQNVVLISPHFYDYEHAIARKIEYFGGNVYYIDERPGNDTFTKGLIRVNPRIIDNVISKYYDKEIDKIQADTVDKVLVISPEAINSKIMQKMRERFMKAKFILYMWDSVHNKTGRDNTEIFHYFNKIFTFDIEDSQKHKKMSFRALFFRDEIATEEQSDYKYDLLFIGSMHSDRYEICRKVQKIFMEKRLNICYYMYIQNKKMFTLQKLINPGFRNAKKSEFKYSPMKYSEVVNLIRNSRIILDIQHPRQSGLTMRTIECVGARKKLISTNKSIKSYDFFKEDNICIIDRENIKIDEAFIASSYSPYDKSLYEKYSLDNWVFDVLS